MWPASQTLSGLPEADASTLAESSLENLMPSFPLLPCLTPYFFFFFFNKKERKKVITQANTILALPLGDLAQVGWPPQHARQAVP